MARRPSSQYIPQGLIYGLAFRSSDYCLIQSVGPDMT